MWLKRNIVMLPTNVSKRYNCTEGLIVKCIKSWTPIGESPREVNKLTISRNWSKGVLDCYEAQHLYIVSDEEIKEGDLRVLKFKNWDNYTETIITNTQFIGGNYDTISEQKIIATTDKSITINDYDSSDEDAVVNYYLSQIPQQFIEKYIEEYNKGNQIEKVMVKYVQELSIDSGGQLIEEAYLKVNSDKTISIKDKINWSVEEVEEILRKCAFHFITNPPSNSENILQVSNQWIKENL